MDTNAIYVLWLRDIKRWLRAYSRIIGTLMMPIFFLLGLGLGLGSLVKLPTGGSYLDFIVPGIIGMSLLFTSIFTGSAVLWDRQFGFLKEIMVTPNSRLSVVIGRICGGATTALLQSVIVIVVGLLAGFTLHISILTPLAIVFMLLIAATFISLGLTLGSLISDFQGFQLVTSFFTMPLFFLSNGIFPISILPTYIQYITYLNPLTYGIDGLRIALLGSGYFPVWLDLLALVVSTVVLMLTAVYAFSKTDVG
jgi:ABC-2 type transport system permease protein